MKSKFYIMTFSHVPFFQSPQARPFTHRVFKQYEANVLYDHSLFPPFQCRVGAVEMR